MKTKLKTLEDIEQSYTYPNGDVSVEDLRREAINWYKHIQEVMNLNSEVYTIYMKCAGELEFIKHFFNLSDEDVK